MRALEILTGEKPVAKSDSKGEEDGLVGCSVVYPMKVSTDAPLL